MLVSNYYRQNIYTSKIKSPNLKIKKDCPFTSNYSCLNKQTVSSISVISQAYSDIMKKISEKTPEGMEIIEKEYKNFKSTRSLVFHNCGKNKTSIQIRVPDGKDGRDFIKIVVKKGNSFVDDRIILDSFTIKNYNQLVEDNNKNRVYIFPDEIKFLPVNKSVEQRLQNVLDDLDIAMLEFRKFLNKYNGMYLKPENFTLDSANVGKLRNIDNLYNNTDTILKNMSHKLSLKLRHDFGDYKLQAAQASHVLKNVGEDQNQIVYKKWNHPEHGNLTRIMIYDKNDNIVDGFLIKDDKLIVSNFNSKNFSIIPPKLLYYDKSSIKEILPKLEKYISDYETKLNEFNKYLSTKLHERSIAPIIGKLNGDCLSDMNLINDIYQELFEKFSGMNNSTLTELKNSYSKWNGTAGQRGFIFMNKDGERIAILKMNSSQGNNVTRLCFTKDGQNTYILVNNGMVIKNYNPKYPTMMPSVMKYYTDIELEDLQLNPFIKKAAEELLGFKKYVDNFETGNLRIKNNNNKTDISLSSQKGNGEIISFSEEYKKLMKECNKKLTQAMKNAQNDMQGFNDTIQEIQSKITEFFTKTEK